jgi:hypothetical protein
VNNCRTEFILKALSEEKAKNKELTERLQLLQEEMLLMNRGTLSTTKFLALMTIVREKIEKCERAG